MPTQRPDTGDCHGVLAQAAGAQRPHAMATPMETGPLRTASL